MLNSVLNERILTHGEDDDLVFEFQKANDNIRGLITTMNRLERQVQCLRNKINQGDSHE